MSQDACDMESDCVITDEEKLSSIKPCGTNREALRPTDTRSIKQTAETLSPELNIIVHATEDVCLCKICQKPAMERSQLCSSLECEREQAIKLLSSLCGRRNSIVDLKQSKCGAKLTENLNERALERQSDTTEIGGSTHDKQPREDIAARSSSYSVSESRPSPQLYEIKRNKREKTYYCEMCKAKLNVAHKFCRACERKKAQLLHIAQYKNIKCNLNLDLNCWVPLERCGAAEKALQLKLEATINENQSSTTEIGGATQDKQPREDIAARSSSYSESESRPSSKLYENKRNKREKTYYCEMCKAKLNVAHKFCQACERKKAQLLHIAQYKNIKCNLNLDMNCWVRLERCEAAEKKALRLKLQATINENTVKRTKVIKCQLEDNIESHTSEKPTHCKMCKTQHSGPHQFCGVCEREQAEKQIKIIMKERKKENPNLLLNHSKSHETLKMKYKKNTETNFSRLGTYNNISCDECGSKFTKRYALVRHMRNKHPYICKTCSVKCKSLVALCKHETIHSKARDRYHLCRP